MAKLSVAIPLKSPPTFSFNSLTHVGGQIDPKRAIPRDEQEKTSKIFVGGVSQETTDHEFREYFAQFGRVVDATLMMDKDTGRPRGFGFVTFESEAGVDACLSTELAIHGKPIEVKKAQPRGNLREEEDASRRGGGGKFGRKNQNGPSGNGNAGMDDAGSNQGGNSAGNNMSGSAMAKYFQTMQSMAAAMAQQNMMNRGMNPAMMQMLQMQQMQQMQQQMMAAAQARAQGGNPMGQMPPQMMQQMQAMQQQMMMNQGGGGVSGGMGPGDQGGNAGGQGGANRPSYNAYEQQHFEQQKYETQQHRRGGGQQQQQPQQQQQQQQNFGNQGFNNNNNMSVQPTSWEGMYDDVPQPNFNQGGPGGGGQGNMGRGGFNNRGRGGFHQQQQQQQQQQQMQQGPVDPTKAPPANAPTGPKNAGKPGANYRGGGRGGNRGFHPYARG
jgi:RNA-binding protein Musashi